MEATKIIPIKQTLARENEKHQHGSSKIIVYGMRSIYLIRQEEILFLEAKGNYCQFWLTNERSYLASKTMGSYQEQLQEDQFIRIHKSYIINIQFIHMIEKKPFKIVLENKMELPVSRTKKSFVLSSLGINPGT